MIYISNRKNNNNNNNIYIEKNYNSINKTLETDSNVIIKPANNFKNIDKSNVIYQKLHNITKTDGNMDVWSYDQERINNDNNIMTYDFINNQRTVRISNINNYNNKINFDNIDYKTKIEKFPVKNYNNNKVNDNKNIKYIIQNDSNTVDVANNYKRINPISNTFIKTPENKQDYKNLINFKLYQKHY